MSCIVSVFKTQSLERISHDQLRGRRFYLTAIKVENVSESARRAEHLGIRTSRYLNGRDASTFACLSERLDERYNIDCQECNLGK